MNAFYFLLVSVSGGTLSKGSREYRTPPAVAPPQVPSHYAPNYPMGHSRRSGERGPGYSTLPMAPQAMTIPQVGMVHPMNIQQSHPQTPPPPPPPGNQGGYINNDHMPPPPSPLVNSQEVSMLAREMQHHPMMTQRAPVPLGSLGMHTLSHAHGQRLSRGSGAHSPPLPPPPPPEDEHEAFGRPRTSGVMPIVPDEEDLPGWVPKNYIEKGNFYCLNNLFRFYKKICFSCGHL